MQTNVMFCENKKVEPYSLPAYKDIMKDFPELF